MDSSEETPFPKEPFFRTRHVCAVLHSDQNDGPLGLVAGTFEFQVTRVSLARALAKSANLACQAPRESECGKGVI